MCLLMTVLRVADSELTDTFQSDSRLQPGFSYLLTLLLSAVELDDAIGFGSAVNGTGLDMATSLMAWNAMKRLD